MHFTSLVAAAQSELGPLPGHAVGVGPLSAAIGATRVLAGGSGPVLLIGSAGVYPGHDPQIGALYSASQMGLSGGISELGLGYLPLPVQVFESTHPLPYPLADTLTVSAITSDKELAQKRGQRWRLEHMECYAVAQVCAVLGRPFAALLGVSNVVGPDAHAQWRQHRAQVEALLQEAAAQLLRDTARA